VKSYFCRRCETTKPLNADNFFRSKDRSTGFQVYCKSCSQALWKKRRRYHPKKRDVKKIRARSAIYNGLKSGTVTKKPCAVCDKKTDIHAHHFNYDKPLLVIWLCRKHHAELHREAE
jgi:hypothetical protein